MGLSFIFLFGGYSKNPSRRASGATSCVTVLMNTAAKQS